MLRHAFRSVATIEGHLTSMGKEYEMINDQLAKGEAEGYSDGPGPQLGLRWA